MTLPGAVTYTNVTCPVCGAVLQLGTQAISPAYTTTATCPYCGYSFGTQVVSETVVSGPTNPYYAQQTTGLDMNQMLQMIMMIVMMGMMMGMMIPIGEG
jgi:cytochrome c biogenesis factor